MYEICINPELDFPDIICDDYLPISEVPPDSTVDPDANAAFYLNQEVPTTTYPAIDQPTFSADATDSSITINSIYKEILPYSEF